MNRQSRPLSIAHRDHHFAAIVQHSFDAIVSKDVDGTVQSWNPAAERIFGWTAAEMIGRSIRVLIPADRQHEEDDILRRIRAGEMVPKFETERLHKNGHR
ncbi:PAS domain S-box protein, partial [Rhodopseudomonas sp. BR0C11]|uniref:PAS domain S-box protein n=1 Tax=Rhodopseudomonas sp. BR0C11 TaxID=2269370 RepID=UPI0013DF7E73